MQVYCTRCGHQFQVARQGQVYCPSCGVLLGPAPAQPAGEQDPASGVLGYAPPGYTPPSSGIPGYPGYPSASYPPPGYPAPAPSTVPLPPSPYPSAAGAVSSPYGYSPTLAAASAVAAKADRRLHRRAWVLRAGLIVVALLLVVGAGAGFVSLERQQQSAQGGATATPEIRIPDGFIAFSDPGGIFACGVPVGWEQVSSTSASLTLAEFGDPVQQTTLTIQYTSSSSLDEVGSDDQALQSLAASYSGGKISGKTHAANGAFAGEAWAEEDATLTYAGASGPATLHVATLSAIHNVTTSNTSTRYVVTMIEVAPAASFNTTDANDFQVVQSSFVFLS